MRYLQVKNDGIITDCIDYPYADYIPYDGEVPSDVMGGWYKLIDGVIIEFPELKPIDEATEIEQLKASQQEQDDLLMDILLGRV